MKALVVFLFLVLVGIFAWFSRTCCDGDLRIERELSADFAATDVPEKDMTNVTAKVDHLDLVLEGTVEMGRKDRLVESVIRELRAGRVIDLLEEVEAKLPPLPSTVFFQRKGSEVHLSGRVANEVLKQRVAEIAYQMPVVRTVVNDMEVSDRAHPVPDARLIAGFGAVFMREAEQGFFEWSPERFVMRGEVPSMEIKNRIENQVEPLLHGRTLENHLTVPTVAVDGASCVVATGVDGRQEGILRGSVGSAEVRAQAVLAAREGAPEILWTEELGVVPDSEGYSSAGFPGLVRVFLEERKGQIGGFSQGPAGITILGASDSAEEARWRAILERPAPDEPESIIAFESADSPESVLEVEAVEIEAGVTDSAVTKEATEPQAGDLVKLKEELSGLAVYFGTNQETASAEEFQKVAQAYRLLEGAGHRRGLVVAGYADARGNAAYNKALSLRRAATIKAELVRLGVAPEQIELKSFGAAEVAGADEDAASERRVEIHLRD